MGCVDRKGSEGERESRESHGREEYGKMKGEAGEGVSVSVFASKACQAFVVHMLQDWLSSMPFPSTSSLLARQKLQGYCHINAKLLPEWYHNNTKLMQD